MARTAQQILDAFDAQLAAWQAAGCPRSMNGPNGQSISYPSLDEWMRSRRDLLAAVQAEAVSSGAAPILRSYGTRFVGPGQTGLPENYSEFPGVVI